MSVGTLQYSSVNTQDIAAGDFTIKAATDKYQNWDPAGSGRTVDLLYVDTSETGVTTSLGDIWIRNTADAAEAITLRDGNNSDAAICVIEQNLQAHVRWNGSNWTSTTGAT